jgi:hypothetical protein
MTGAARAPRSAGSALARSWSSGREKQVALGVAAAQLDEQVALRLGRRHAPAPCHAGL